MSPANALNQDNSDGFRSPKYENWLIQFILATIAVLTIADIISDIGEGATVDHLIGEGLIALLSGFGIIVLWLRNANLKSEVLEQKKLRSTAENDRAQAIAEAKRWKLEASTALQGLSDAIDLQLTRWQLTPAEKEVALLLLKGLSLKEIATVRGVGEKTARAQSFSVYAKSGLSGRAELSAFFLEDLLVPQSRSGNQSVGATQRKLPDESAVTASWSQSPP